MRHENLKLAAKKTLTPKLTRVTEKAPIATADPFAEPHVRVTVTSSSVATHAPNAADTQWLHRSAPSNGTESLTVPDHGFALPLSIPLAPGVLEKYFDGGDQLHFLSGGEQEQPLASVEASLDGGEPSGSEHLFQEALQALLLGCPYENSVKADDAFIRFTQVGCSAMHQKDVFVPKRESSAFVKTVIYRCGVDHKKCPFRIKLSVLKSGLVTFDLCGAGAAQSHNEDEVGSLKQSLRYDKHVGHELQRPVRATSLVQNVAKRLEREVREDGRSGSDHTNAIICKAAALGIDLNATAVNALKRQLCMEKLHSRILKRVPMDSVFKLGETLIDMATTSESSLHASAVLGILVTLQQQQPNAYIRVVVVNSCIQYACFATEKMRDKGIYKIECYVYSDHVSTNYGGALLIQYTSYRESVW